MALKIIPKPLRFLFRIGFVLLVILILLPAVLAYRAKSQMDASFRWVTHTMEVKGASQQLLSDLVETENDLRGYRLTQNNDQLSLFEAARDRIVPAFQKLKTLTADNSLQQSRLDELYPIILQSIAGLNDNVALARTNESDRASFQLAESGNGRVVMEKIRTLSRVLNTEEDRLLVIRQANLARELERNSLFSILLLAIAALSALAMLYFARRLSKIQPLVKVCAWSNTIEYQGQWVSFEEYLQRRFQISTTHGISPTELERLAAQTQEKRPKVAATG